MDDPTAPSLKSSLLAPLAPGQREWVLGLAGAMLLVNLLRQILPGILAGIVGLLSLVVLSIMAFNAGTDALRQAAAGPGARGARLFGSEFSEGLGVRLIVLWLLATILLAAFMQLDRYLGLAIGLMIVTAILPAVTIVLVLSNSFLEALYPPRLARLIARIGRRDYASLCALVIMGGIAYLTISALLRSLGLPDFLRSALLFGIWTWAVLAWFRHAGDMLFAHRDELNLVEPDSEATGHPRSSRAIRMRCGKKFEAAAEHAKCTPSWLASSSAAAIANACWSTLGFTSKRFCWPSRHPKKRWTGATGCWSSMLHSRCANPTACSR